MAARDELLKIFETAGAIGHGHFELSSGLHSGTYVQCALALQYPRFAEKLGAALAARFVAARIEKEVSPPLGWLVVGGPGRRAGARARVAGEGAGARRPFLEGAGRSAERCVVRSRA